MEISHHKKLARGLKDISPLFSEGEVPAAPSSLSIQILSVSSSSMDDDSLLLNTYLASRLASQETPCSLVSLLSRSSGLCSWRLPSKKSELFGRNIQRHSLYWDEFQDVLAAGARKTPSPGRGGRNVFLDFECRHLLYFPNLLMFLDKWVLLLKPATDSMTEGYKMIKAGLTLNPFLECFVLFEAKANPPLDSSIFEKFAALVSKHLKVNLGWLGWLDLKDPDRFFTAELNEDQLQYRPSGSRLSMEKLNLAAWLDANEVVAHGVC